MITTLEKSINTMLVQIHLKRQGVKSTRKKAPDMDLSDSIKTNLAFFVSVDPSDYYERKIYYDLYGRFPIMTNKGNIYIYIYIYTYIICL